MTYTLAVCAEMAFRELSVHERARRIHDAGFQVETGRWTRHGLDTLARTVAGFSPPVPPGSPHCATRRPSDSNPPGTASATA